jgi:hypothetical protein
VPVGAAGGEVGALHLLEKPCSLRLLDDYGTTAACNDTAAIAPPAHQQEQKGGSEEDEQATAAGRRAPLDPTLQDPLRQYGGDDDPWKPPSAHRPYSFLHSVRGRRPAGLC